jgi:hypothetical protein
MSPRNWDRLVNEHASPLPRALVAPTHPPARKDLPSTSARWITADGKAEILHVRPSLRPAQGSVKSPYAFVVRDASGKLVSETDVLTLPAHVDTVKHGPGEAFLTLAGDVPAGPKPASLELTDDGKVMAVQKASAHAPVVRLLAPRRGQQVGGRGAVTVRWQASDADGDPLQATIDYSSDGGNTFRTIEQGTEGTSFCLPARYFSASHNARLRLRVSDGFNETRVLSAPFRATGAPPEVKIEGSPKRLQLRADATLALTGYAFSDSGQLFRDNRLRWFEGKRLVGRGSHLVQAGLPVGTRRLQLRVRLGGRTGVANVVLSVRPVTPQFLLLRMPKRLSPRAKGSPSV